MDPTTAAAGAAELLDRELTHEPAGDVVNYDALLEDRASTVAKYRNLVEQLPCVVYLAEYGPDGDWLYVSPQIEHVLGYTQKEWLEHPHPQGSFTHPDDLPAVEAEEARSLAAATPSRSSTGSVEPTVSGSGCTTRPPRCSTRTAIRSACRACCSTSPSAARKKSG